MPAAERPTHTVLAGKRSGQDVVGLFRDATVAVLRALGADADVDLEWTVTARDRYEVSWPGERLGPSTLTRVVGRAGEVSAEFSLDVVRWSPHSIHQTTLSYRWAVGDETAGGVTLLDGDRRFKSLTLIGPAAVADVLQAAMRRGA